MQITFLGASHGVPEANRRCSCTLIETNGRYYFIDMGVNAIDALRTRGIEVEDVKGIFITHMHGDHTNGLISFVDLISWYFKTADPEICLPNLEGVEAIRAWLKANHCEMRDLRFKKVTDGTIFDDGYLKVTAIPTQHCPDSHAFFVEAEGKAVLFKEFGGVDAFPICIDAHDAASVIAACKAIAPTFGGINLEDIKSPECFEIEETLERELDIPVFHDDQHGTAIVVTAALINALRVVGKKMEDVHIVLNGPGAAGTAIIKMLMTAGAKDIIAVDQFGTLYKGCNSAEAHKNWLGEVTNPRQIKGGLKEALEGADVFIGVSRPGILTTELCKTMNKDAIVFAMANPTPEIMPDEAKAGGVRVMATGRSDFPNQVNNVLCFPGLFKGALSVRARDINNEMKLAAAYAIADLITDADRSEENIIPGAFDPRVAEAVANAVAKAARETGVARL